MKTASNYDLKIKQRIKLVHIAANELGLLDPKRHNTDPDDEYHTILARWHRPGTRQLVTSSTQMSYQQLGELLEFFKALGFRFKKGSSGSNDSNGLNGLNKKGSWKKYDSSMQGLKDELCDLARGRFGVDGWEQPLNSLCQRCGVKRWQWLDVAHAKSVKEILHRMNRDDARQQQKPFATEGTEKNEVPF